MLRLASLQLSTSKSTTVSNCIRRFKIHLPVTCPYLQAMTALLEVIDVHKNELEADVFHFVSFNTLQSGMSVM